MVVPLKPKALWKDALAFTREIAEAMAADEPDRYTPPSVKQEREGRIFIDYLRNNREAWAVAPFLTRSRPGAPVSDTGGLGGAVTQSQAQRLHRWGT